MIYFSSFYFYPEAEESVLFISIKKQLRIFTVLPAFLAWTVLSISSVYSLDLKTPEGTQVLLEQKLTRWSFHPLEDLEEGGAPGYRYVLKKPVDGYHQYLRLQYSCSEYALLTVETDTGETQTWGVLPGEKSGAFLVGCKGNIKILTLQTEKRTGSVRIGALALSPEPPENTDFIYEEGTYRFTFEQNDSGCFLSFRNPEYKKSDSVRISLKTTDGRDISYSSRILPGMNRLYFYSEILGSPAESCTVTGPDGLVFLSAEPLRLPEIAPIPADYSTILEWPVRLWRQPEYELFSWSVYPDVYVFVFRDNEAQSAYFRRLAFHQEKKYFRGKLLTDKELAGRRDWNAHDYGTKSFTSFYNQVEDEDFPLSEKELEFRSLLIDLGILVPDDNGRFAEGKGAVISCSMDFGYGERLYYLTHEGCHGLFFTNPEFKKQIEDLWASQSEETREIWRIFFNKYTYDASDEYLCVNEFQAYLLQQPVVNANSYFRWRFGSLFDAGTDNGTRIFRFLEENPRYFAETAAETERILSGFYGLSAGDFRTLTRE